MTLTTKIQLARKALKIGISTMDYDGWHGTAEQHALKEALAALPEPMIESDIAQMINELLDNSTQSGGIIRALREAGVLYVKEK